MKQNERLLVYAVTGFLALILVIAVLFGSEPVDAAKKQEKLSQGLDDILRPNDVDAELAKAKAAADAQAKALLQQLGQGGDPVGGKIGSEQPLIAKTQTASTLIAMKLGESRRERFVRWVAVKPGDSFEKLVRRWCGSTQPYLNEAISLNEDTRTLIAGEQVMVPWVDDEVLAGIIEAEAPRTLVSSPQHVGGVGVGGVGVALEVERATLRTQLEQHHTTTTVTRASSSGSRLFGVSLGPQPSHHAAERLLLRTALSEIGTFDQALRRIAQRSGGYEARFQGLTEDQAARACARLTARAIPCGPFGPAS